MKTAKCQCQMCYKTVANLVRHMKKVHNVSLKYGAPATDMYTFAKLLAQFPLPLDRWTTLLDNKRDMMRFLNNQGDLSPELYKILSEGLDIYKLKKTKLILLNEKGATDADAIDDENNFLGCFKCIKGSKGLIIKNKNTIKRKKISSILNEVIAKKRISSDKENRCGADLLD